MEYCKNPGNIAAAARSVGIGVNTARSWVNDSDSIIRGAIDEKMRQRIEQLDIDANWVLQELLLQYNSDVSDIYNEETNSMLPVHQWPEQFRRSGVGVKVREHWETMEGVKLKIGETVEARFMDKKALLDLIGKHIQVRAFAEQTLNVTETQLAARIAKGRERMNKRNRERKGLTTPDVPTPPTMPTSFL